MTRRSSFGPTALVGLAGAGLATVAANQTWATATTASPAVRTVAATGTDVVPLALPLALVALASWGAILVLRARGRRIVAVIGLAASVGAIVALVPNAHRAPDIANSLAGDVEASLNTTAWPFIALAALAVTAVTFGVAAAVGRSWPEMSSRYDAPGSATDGSGRAPEELSDRDLWKALDEGHDPTA